MQRQKEIIARRLTQIAKMRAYVVYSSGRMRAAGVAEKNLQQLVTIQVDAENAMPRNEAEGRCP
jgi:hypothetical protein